MVKREKTINTDICVIGGGMAGICAAVSAARHGAKVVLIHDRPVLGGNASSEIRMWIRGASNRFPEYREGGIIEEIANRNILYNPHMTYPLWDAVLYGIVKEEKNISLFLNCACTGAEENNGAIKKIFCRGLNNYTDYTVNAQIFIDCSGDCILADFTSATTMRGREAKGEYGESSAPDKRDDTTMGNTCLIQARETAKAVKYTPPPFAKKFTDEEIARRLNINNENAWKYDNFWWMEIGGTHDSLADAEEIKDELLSVSYGVWDYIKNSGRFDSANWDLDFVSYIGAKRESRRYKGDYVLTQEDIDRVKPFDDEIAYGGWTMDDHNSLGMETNEPPNIHYMISSPYAIPYRCIYSCNIKNLLFAGRNISVTHLALSSTRVMATCAILGQAAGTAAALCVFKNLSAKELNLHIFELKDMLLNDDCFLLDTNRENGLERKIEDIDNAKTLSVRKPYDIFFPKKYCDKIRIVFDDDIARSYISKRSNERQFPQQHNVSLGEPTALMPPVLAKEFEVWVKNNNVWEKVFSDKNNYKRLVFIPCGLQIEGIRLIVNDTYGGQPRLYSFDC